MHEYSYLFSFYWISFVFLLTMYCAFAGASCCCIYVCTEGIIVGFKLFKACLKEHAAVPMNHCEVAAYHPESDWSINHQILSFANQGSGTPIYPIFVLGQSGQTWKRSLDSWLSLNIAFDFWPYFVVLRSRWYFKSIDRGIQLATELRLSFDQVQILVWLRFDRGRRSEYRIYWSATPLLNKHRLYTELRAIQSMKYYANTCRTDRKSTGTHRLQTTDS